MNDGDAQVRQVAVPLATRPTGEVRQKVAAVAPKCAPAAPESLDRAADRLIGTLLPGAAAHDDEVPPLLIGLPEPDGAPFRNARVRPGPSYAVVP